MCGSSSKSGLTLIMAQVRIMNMKFNAWYLTDKGLKRDSNQDNFLINQDLGIFIVADGMGGHFGGEVASAMAVATVEEVFKDPRSQAMSARELLEHAFAEASRRIFDKALDEPKLNGMGTTMVMGYMKNNTFYVANVGDSRCYLYKKPYVWQLTEDHSLLNEQIRSGIMTEEQARAVVGRNVITRSVGFEREVVPDIIEKDITSGEIFLLCSDGLSSLVADEKINEIMNSGFASQIVERCVEQALNNGGDDNVTVLAVQFL